MRKKIIVVTGLPGSGKSEVSSVIKRMRIPTFLTGEIVKREVARRGLAPSAESSEYTARELRKRYGPEAPIRLVEHKIDSLKSRLVCVDGPRSIKEVDYLRMFGDVYLILVESSRKLRFSRIKKRGSPDDPSAWKDFLWTNQRELERGMRSLSKTKRFHIFRIRNVGSVPALKPKIRKIISHIKKDRTGHLSAKSRR